MKGRSAPLNNIRGYEYRLLYDYNTRFPFTSCVGATVGAPEPRAARMRSSSAAPPPRGRDCSPPPCPAAVVVVFFLEKKLKNNPPHPQRKF
jgi:hypothetical protein